MFVGKENYEQGTICYVCGHAPFAQLGAGALMNHQLVELLTGTGPPSEQRFIHDFDSDVPIIDRCIKRYLGGSWCHFASDWGLGACIREAMTNETYAEMTKYSVSALGFKFKQHRGCPPDMLSSHSRWTTCHLKAAPDEGMLARAS